MHDCIPSRGAETFPAFMHFIRLMLVVVYVCYAYVAPNIEGRVHGGFLDARLTGVSDPNPSRLQVGSEYGAQGDFYNSNTPDRNAAKYGTRQSQAPLHDRGSFSRRLPGGGGTTIDNETGAPLENPGGVEGGYNFMTDPGYNFRIGEGERALERSAAARGGLLSGGFGRKLTRYAQDYASNEYTNVYNRISNIAGLGQVSAGQSGQAALIAGQGMGTAAAQRGLASAYGNQASNNAWANAANQIGQLPWENIFGGGGGGSGSGTGRPRA